MKSKNLIFGNITILNFINILRTGTYYRLIDHKFYIKHKNSKLIRIGRRHKRSFHVGRERNKYEPYCNFLLELSFKRL